MSIDQITSAAMKLSSRERATLAESLWESIEDPFDLASDMTDEEALKLAVARDGELESGNSSPLAHSDLMRRLRNES